MGVFIKSFGSYVPGAPITTEELLKRYPLDASAEALIQVTGIEQRHWVESDQATSDLAFNASKAALKSASLPATDLQHIILATATADYISLATACRVQHLLGASCPAIDMVAACAGFIHALHYGVSLVKNGADNILVIGADCKSRFSAKDDLTFLPVFADGAGAVVLSSDDSPRGFGKIVLKTDGQYFDTLKVAAGGSAMPASEETVRAGQHFTTTNWAGKKVALFAVEILAELAVKVVDQAGLTLKEVDYIVPHQPNGYILRRLVEVLDYPMEQVVVTINKFGNTGAASLPMGIAALLQRDLPAGKNVLLMTAGSGITAGAVIYHT